MLRQTIVLIIALVYSVNGATQFVLQFAHSANKVIVTDYYYMLEYSIVKGEQLIELDIY